MVTHSQWLHVFDSWSAGQRKSHHKFGKDILCGIGSLDRRLRRIHECFPEALTSMHLFHELRWDGGSWEDYNSPDAIGYFRLRRGIEESVYPKISALTFPAFGWRGTENGVILNPDPKIAEIGRLGHRQVMAWSREIKAGGLGLGHNIWWDGEDMHKSRGPLSKISGDQGRQAFIDFWAPILKETGDVIHFEWKPAVPGVLGFCPTMRAAIALCWEINQLVGRVAMVINFEWAHGLCAGETVEEDTKLQVDNSMFTGLLHANSAELAIVRWNEAGTEIEEGTPGDDKDWPVGRGGPKRREDQKCAVRILDRLGVPIAVEHDLDPEGGQDPMECFAESQRELDKMIREVRAEAGALL